MTRSETNERHPCNRYTLAVAVMRMLPGIATITRKRRAAQMKLKLEAK